MTNQQASTARTAQRLDDAIDRALSKQRLAGCVVLVARNGQIAYRRAAGHLDREAGTAMREDAIFRYASVSKPIVTVAALRMAERGEIALTDPVTRWLPDFQPALSDGTQPEITLHQLLTHSSGLGYRFTEAADSAYHALEISDGLDISRLSLADNLALLAQAPLLFAPGWSWMYSLGLDVIGAVLEVAGGVPLDQIVRKEVTEPLGMVDTGFIVTDPTRLAVPYANGTDGPVRMEGTVTVPLPEEAGLFGAIRFSPDRIFEATAFRSGGAGMAGTAEDILTLLETIRRGGQPILRSATAASMFRAHVGAEAEAQGPGWGFGYGGAVLTDPLLAETPQAAGTLQWGGAYGHYWFVDPANRLTVVALTDTAFEGMAGRFVFDVRDAVYG